MVDEVTLLKKSMVPFFSVIIPTYNRATLLEVAIRSVVAQTFSDWELLVVDDGSTDNTAALVQSYAASDPRIKYIYQQNSERSAARNNGIKQSQGKYICFLDSDDYFLESRLMLLFDRLGDNTRPTMFYTGLLIDEVGKAIHEREEQKIEGVNQFDLLVAATIHSQQVCISREIMLNFQFNRNIRISEDLELWLRINSAYPIVFIENQYTVALKEHEARSINFLKNNVGLEQLETLRICFSSDHPGAAVAKEVKAKVISNAYLTIFKYWMYQRNRSKSILYLIKSILAHPTNAQTKYKLNLVLKLSLFQNFDLIKRIV